VEWGLHYAAHGSLTPKCLIDILAEFYEDMEDGDNEIWADIDMMNEDMGGMASHMMEIIKLQSRVGILEKTVEFTRNDGM